MKLKTYEKSEKVIQEALKEQANDLNSLIAQAKFTGLLAMVHERSGDIDLALRSLTEAKEIRAKLLKRIQVEQPDAVLDHKQLTANICHQMAEHAVNKRDFDTGKFKIYTRYMRTIAQKIQFDKSLIVKRCPIVYLAFIIL